MSDVVKHVNIKQIDGTYESKEIGVDYENVIGLDTEAVAFKAKTADSATTSKKAVADKNNKDITEYVSSISKNGSSIKITDGADNDIDVNLSMQGATAISNGAAGFVPQPLTTDVNKFLKSDGTWDSPASTAYIGSDNIDINSNTKVIDLTDTDVAAGTYGPTADVTGTNGTSITIPQISVDDKGRITEATMKTYTSVDTQYSNPSGNNTININNTNKTLSLGSHASSADTYGKGNTSNFGHVKLSDTYSSSVGAAQDGVGASQKAVADAYTSLRNTVNNLNAGDINFDGSTSGLESTEVQSAIEELVANFQDGVDAVYDTCVAKGSTPASHSLSDVVEGIENIETGITPTGTISITTNGVKDVTQYASANVAVPASAVTSGTYNYPSGSTGGTVDITQYKSVNASNVYNKGKADGRSFSSQTKTFTVNSPHGGRWETLTAQCTFPTKIVGITSYDNGSSPWHCVMSIGFSGNTITAVVDGYESSSPWTFNVTAIGY